MSWSRARFAAISVGCFHEPVKAVNGEEAQMSDSAINPAATAELDRERLKSAAASIRHPLTRALLVLTLTTGLVDAVCYLGLGRVFAANMTGNIVLLGFGIAGSGGLPIVAPLVSLAAFLAGSAAGGVLAARTGERRAEHFARALWIEFGFVVATVIVAALVDVRPST